MTYFTYFMVEQYCISHVYPFFMYPLVGTLLIPCLCFCCSEQWYKYLFETVISFPLVKSQDWIAGFHVKSKS